MSDTEDAPGGSGRGDDLGTPSHNLDEGPPSMDQDANEVVSGGGVVDPDEDQPSDAAES